MTLNNTLNIQPKIKRLENQEDQINLVDKSIFSHRTSHISQFTIFSLH